MRRGQGAGVHYRLQERIPRLHGTLFMEPTTFPNRREPKRGPKLLTGPGNERWVSQPRFCKDVGAEYPGRSCDSLFAFLVAFRRERWSQAPNGVREYLMVFRYPTLSESDNVAEYSASHGICYAEELIFFVMSFWCWVRIGWPPPAADDHRGSRWFCRRDLADAAEGELPVWICRHNSA